MFIYQFIIINKIQNPLNKNNFKLSLPFLLLIVEFVVEVYSKCLFVILVYHLCL